MTDLLNSLRNHARGLAAHTSIIQTAGQNIQNADNPHYARQRVSVQSLGSVQTDTGFSSLGIAATQIEHFRDSLLDAQIATEASATASLEAQQRIYAQMETDLGEIINRRGDAQTLDGADINDTASAGISRDLEHFFNSVLKFSASPTEISNKESLISEANILIDRFRQLDSRVSAINANAASQVEGDVNKAKELLDKIASLNKQIIDIEVHVAGAAVDLRDARQEAIEELSKYMSFKSSNITDSFGSIQLTTKDDTGADVVLVDGIYVKGTLDTSGTDLTFGGATLDLTGGSLYGYQRARTEAIPDFLSKIDNLANQIVSSVNSAYNPTSGPDNFFDPAGTTAGTIAIASGLTAANLKATDTANSGANELADAIYALKETSFSIASGDFIDGRFIDHIANLTAEVGQRLYNIESKMSHQGMVEAMLIGQRDSYGGVSTNEELSDLIRAQRIYQSITKVISITDELLNTVVNGIIR